MPIRPAAIASTAGDGIDPRHGPIPGGAVELSSLDGSERVLLGRPGDPGEYSASADVIAAYSGAVRLAQGTITIPAAFVDLMLPEGFLRFRIEWSGVRLSADQGTFAASVSCDDGTTFVNDPDNFDSYLQALQGWSISDRGSAGLKSATLGLGFGDSLIDIAPQGVTAYTLLARDQGALDAVIHLDPGSATQHIRGRVIAWAEGLDGQTPTAGILQQAIDLSFVVDPHAIIPPPAGRANAIRFQPYGNGTANPPTSGDMITAGSYVLTGIPVEVT